MRNRILDITRNTIPYVKELRPIAGSVTACIVMQQLDYWFARHPDGFYKFMDRCEAKEYKAGDSWAEELGMTKDEFRSAFDRIGTRYTTKAAFLESDDKFRGKFYCSYYDKKEGLTWYYRNHSAVDGVLDTLISSVPTPSSLQMENPISEMDNPISTNGISPFTQMDNPISYKGTETTAQSTLRSTASNAAELNNSVSAEQIEANTQSLIQLRLEPTAARKLATQYPERIAVVTAHWSARGFDGIQKPAGAVRDSIERPEKWPEIYAPHANGSTPARSTPPPKLPPVKVLEAAAAAAFEALTTADQHYIRGCMEMENKTLREAMIEYRDSEFARALKDLQKAR